jgi:hypothetical protein
MTFECLHVAEEFGVALFEEFVGGVGSEVVVDGGEHDLTALELEAGEGVLFEVVGLGEGLGLELGVAIDGAISIAGWGVDGIEYRFVRSKFTVGKRLA